MENAEEAQLYIEKVWNYPIPYELLKTSEYIVLANQDHLLDSDYIPPDLVKLTVKKISSTPIEMRAAASEALSTMFSAAKEDGITLYAHSGYRSYKTQNTMYYNRLKKNNGKDDGVVAYPGSSDHQTGLGIDVINKAGIGKKFTSAFAKTKEGQWVAEHCWEYGFVIRYQKEKEDITKIIYEPWHLRYVGIQVAEYMRDMNYCLEEFTDEWQRTVYEYEH
ncbi:MAG: M15 family metallopeptidase [Clostridia bacterium]|nr:M15 family metallopeptidase [Clostridia bacterium]